MHQTFAALADPTRLRIVEFLGSSPHSVGEICDTLALGQPQASKHLRVLREARVVEVEARAQQRIYALRPAALRELSEWLEQYQKLWDERLDQLSELIEELHGQQRKQTKKRGKR